MLRRVHQKPMLGRPLAGPWRIIAARNINTEKMATGSLSALSSSAITTGVFHLFVCQVPAAVAAGTLAAATVSGACIAIEGGKDDAGGASFGTVCGMFFGFIGGYYAKTSQEPWH